MKLFGEVVVFGHDVVPVFDAVVVFFHEVVALDDEIADAFVLPVDAVVGFFELGFQRGDALLVLGDGVAKAKAGELQLADFALLAGDKLGVGLGGVPEFSDLRIHAVDLKRQGGDGVGAIADGNGFFIDHAVEGFDGVALRGLLMPLINAQAAQGEGEADEQVLLKIFHVESGLIGRGFDGHGDVLDAGAFHKVEDVDDGTVFGRACAGDVNGQVGVQVVTVGQQREQFGKRCGLAIHGNLTELVHGQIDEVRLGGSGLRGGGQVGLERADNLHLQADHHERREQKEHDVNQRDDFQPGFAVGQGRADFHGREGTG